MTTTQLVKGREARASLPAPLTVAAGRQHTAETILRAWLEGKSEHTIRSYSHDLEDFAQYLSAALAIHPRMSGTEALSRLFKQSSPSAHEIVLGFRHYLGGAHLSAGTINRHIATLRSVSKLGRMLGLITWYLEVPGVKAEKRRITAGPTTADVLRMLDATRADTEGETRDYAIIVTFYCLGLRVSELCGLTMQETDLARGSTWIKGKSRREKELVPLPQLVVDAIRRYLEHRGTQPGPLFQSRGHRGKNWRATLASTSTRNGYGALETRSVLRIVRELGAKVGLHVWCHGIRHSAITTAIEHGQKAGLGLDQIRHFSRHKTLATMLIYRDEHDKAATQKTLADVVAGTLTNDV